MRRDQFLAGAGALFGLGPAACGPPPDGRVLRANIVANTLGIHVPYVRALSELLPATPGYGPVRMQRVSKLETITQAMLTGSSEIGTGDALSSIRAIQAGADLRIIGNCFMNTSLVFVANRERAPTDADLLRRDISIAVNSENDATHVMLTGPLLRRGIDIRRANVISMGGSGARLRALLSNRIDAAPVHADQANALIETGRFRILIEPWREFPNYLGEVWLVTGDWLRQPANRRAAVDLLRAVVTAFRAANDDPVSYSAAYRAYGTEISMRTRAFPEIEAYRRKLSQVVKAWPRDNGHSLEVYRELIPQYVRFGALKSPENILDSIDTDCLAQALNELDG